MPKLKISLFELNSLHKNGEKLIAECEGVPLLEYLMKPKCEFNLKAKLNTIEDHGFYIIIKDFIKNFSF